MLLAHRKILMVLLQLIKVTQDLCQTIDLPIPNFDSHREIAIDKGFKKLMKLENIVNEDENNAHVDDLNTSKKKETKMIERKAKKNDEYEEIFSKNLYNCEECGKTCKSTSALRYHKERVHDGIMYPCNICNGKFAQMSNLRTHIRTMHEGDRKFACHHCDFKAGQKGNLMGHIKRRHNLK